MSKKRILGAAIAVAAACGSMTAGAADWSDTSIGYRYGTRFAEPYGRTDIQKNIYSLTHVSGYKYGTNFFNADLLQSGSQDPGQGTTQGAQEVYVVYRHTFDIGKISGKNLKWGVVRGWGLTLGFDWNTKNDGYGSKKRMLVAGPTVSFDVPGFLDVSLLWLDESNAPNGINTRYHYKDHAALNVAWGIPIGGTPLSFGGYFLHIGSKGQNELGGPTAAETHLDAKLMLDLGAVAGGPKNTFLVGFAYEYWKNKFGNPTTGLPVVFAGANGRAGPGATAKTPMIRAEYHF